MTKLSLQEMQKTMITFREASLQISKKEEDLRRFAHQIDTLESSGKLGSEQQLRVRIFKKRREIRSLSSEFRKIRNYDSDSEVL